MTVIIFDDLDDLNLATAWDRLSANQQQRNPFSTREWLTAWSKSYKDTHRPLIICIERQAKILAVLPFMIKGGQIMYLADNAADYAQILIDPDAISELSQAMQRSARFIRGVRFKFWNMRSDRLITDQFMSVVKAGARRINISSQIIYRVRLPETWEGMLLGIKGKARETIRRNNRRLRDLGAEYTRVSHIASGELEEIFALHEQRWSSKAQVGQFSDERRRTLWRYILVDKHIAGVRLSRLRLKGDLLAYHLGFEESGSLMGWGASFNTGYSKFGPGGVLLSNVIETCIRDGYTEFDFLRGDEDYKKVWSNSVGKIITVDGTFG